MTSKCLEVVVVSQLFPVTWMHACMGALMPWHSTVVSHAAWWAFAEGTVAQQFLSVSVMLSLLKDVHYILPLCRSLSILATYALMPQSTSATVSTLLMLWSFLAPAFPRLPTAFEVLPGAHQEVILATMDNVFGDEGDHVIEAGWSLD